MKPLDFDYPQRSASALYYWASRNIPHNVKKIYHLEDLPGWVDEVHHTFDVISKVLVLTIVWILS